MFNKEEFGGLSPINYYIFLRDLEQDRKNLIEACVMMVRFIKEETPERRRQVVQALRKAGYLPT